MLHNSVGPFLGLVSSVCECKNDAVKSALVDCIKLVYLLVDYCHVRALSSSCAMIDSSGPPLSSQSTTLRYGRERWS